MESTAKQARKLAVARVVLENETIRVLEVTIARASGSRSTPAAGRVSWWSTGRRESATTPPTP